MIDRPYPKTNVPEFSVSELAFNLKKTLESNFSHVRVRGELSRVSIPSSGHMYTSLKDDNAVIDAVCWRGNLKKLGVRPEEGLEVICTGRITTYAPRSNYQLIIETMELAGEGALLKMLEERKKKLAKEGLFSTEHKLQIPFIPRLIGVITSPTGAVIRDILHRLNDRFPRDVLLWPVMVQGEGAARQVEEAIKGFNNISHDSGFRPDLLIVARGGGSLEDLMPFNEEEVVRAIYNSEIPIISAIGHETDTTLADYAADLRAPTPTGAAEMAVPMRINLIAQIKECEQRLARGMVRFLSENQHKLATLEAKLGKPEQIIETKSQKTDYLSQKLDRLFENALTNRHNQVLKISMHLIHPSKLLETRLAELENKGQAINYAYGNYIRKSEAGLMAKSIRLRPPKQKIQNMVNSVDKWGERLSRACGLTMERKQSRLNNLGAKLDLLSFENVLKRGYTVIFSEEGNIITDCDELNNGQNIRIRFKDKKYARAKITGKD